MPGAEAAGGAPAPPPGPPPGGASTQFSAKTLSSLLSTQENGSGASDVANKLISDLDSNGDGSLSLAEVQAGLQSSDSSGVAASMAKLDTNGDGQLNGSELTTALQGAHKGHHAHHAPPAAGDVASKMISALDTNGDGSLSQDEIQAALKTDGTASANTGDTLNAAIAKLDTNGDGKIGASELTSALQAFRDANERGQKAGTTETSIAA